MVNYQQLTQEKELKKEAKMPKVGDKEFAYTEQGMADAKAESAETGIPISDGATRNVTEYAGGGKTGYNAIGNPMYGHGGMTGMDKYKKGGKVMDIPGEQVKFASERKKKEGFKPSKKGKFFSKEKRAERREARKARRDKRKDKTKSFSQKFKEERSKQGAGGTFTWNGKSYTTDRADDKKKAKGKFDKSLGMKPKKAAIKTPKPKKFSKKTKRPKDVGDIVAMIPPAKKKKNK